jgi:hypothetical protein
MNRLVLLHERRRLRLVVAERRSFLQVVREGNRGRRKETQHGNYEDWHASPMNRT